jgi:hypothetical protein
MAPRMLSILRIAAGFLFMPNGTLKLFNYPPPPHPMAHLPPLMCNSLDSTLRTALARFYVSDTD